MIVQDEVCTWHCARYYLHISLYLSIHRYFHVAQDKQLVSATSVSTVRPVCTAGCADCFMSRWLGQVLMTQYLSRFTKVCVRVTCHVCLASVFHVEMIWGIFGINAPTPPDSYNKK